MGGAAARTGTERGAPEEETTGERSEPNMALRALPNMGALGPWGGAL